MAANTANAIKAYLEAQGLGVSVYRDLQPPDTALPFITVFENIGMAPEPAFNSFDDSEKHVRELVQVDVWQMWRDTTGEIQESYTLPDAVVKALMGARLSAGPTHVAGVNVVGMVRTLGEPGDVGPFGQPLQGKVRHAITVEVRRTLTAV